MDSPENHLTVFLKDTPPFFKKVAPKKKFFQLGLKKKLLGVILSIKPNFQRGNSQKNLKKTKQIF